MRNNNRNYNKKSAEVEEIVEQPVAEPEPVVEEKIVSPKMGVVTECLQLNVRKAPSPDAEVVTVIDFASDVLIDESESTDDFYKITTATSVEGFCMKQFIAV